MMREEGWRDGQRVGISEHGASWLPIASGMILLRGGGRIYLYGGEEPEVVAEINPRGYYVSAETGLQRRRQKPTHVRGKGFCVKFEEVVGWQRTV